MTDQPPSTAPAAAAHPLVQGRCPACGWTTLFLGSGGYVTCSRLDCPDPCAADDLLHRGRPTPGAWLAEGTRDLSIPQQAPRFTARTVTPEEERTATERARQAAEDSVKSAAWFAANSSPHPAEAALARIQDLADQHPVAIDTALIHQALEEAGRTTAKNSAAAATGHVYLSTGCLHGQHAYCSNVDGIAGLKKPAQCKFCTAPCTCPCHTAASGETATQATGESA